MASEDETEDYTTCNCPKDDWCTCNDADWCTCDADGYTCGTDSETEVTFEAKACHKDEAEARWESAVTDWRRCGRHTREELWRAYRDTKPKVTKEAVKEL